MDPTDPQRTFAPPMTKSFRNRRGISQPSENCSSLNKGPTSGMAAESDLSQSSGCE